MEEEVLKRFMRDIRIVDGCWIWTRFRFNREVSDVIDESGLNIRPARWAWRRWCGELDPNKHVISLCGSKHCVNPLHLIHSQRGIELWKALGACPNGHPYNEERIRFSNYPDGRPRYSCMDCVNDSRRLARQLARGRKKYANP